MNETRYCIVTTTIDNEARAREMGRAMLEAKLIACAQLYPIESLYCWEGSLDESKEFLLQMKTKNEHFPAIKKQILQRHTYEVPEILMTPILDANGAYLAWIERETL
ncbi:divalent-cation tolerance protein CutA [Sulfurovum sp. NBC37-1]|uniref:divalent-cation tolerance protein CutA n=1 Tax=Sulfurovum sp. (strain NBC37-1) TaxID=387093 RepID=UPI0001587CBC|nr:divalent-cation tolerance protein CutA [Sulfurovum sp. NBC37-1]BAF72282.1 divalent cation tolerance protein [Sulfurovum sp. NBC37-1]